MKLEVVYKEMTSTEAIQAHIEDRAQKLERLVAPDQRLHVVVEAKQKGHQHSAEIQWHCKLTGHDFHAKSEGHNLYQQIEEAIEKVLKQAQSVHDKNIDSRRRREPAKKISS